MEQSLVFVPRKQITWESPSNCRWDAHEKMHSISSLKSIYEAAYSRIYGATCSRSEDDLNITKQFLKRILGIQDAKWTDYVNELRYLNDEVGTDEGFAVDSEWTYEIYEILDELRLDLDEEECNALR